MKKSFSIVMFITIMFAVSATAQKKTKQLFSEELFTTIQAQSNPSGAQVYLEGRAVGNSTPTNISLTKQLNQVSLAKVDAIPNWQANFAQAIAETHSIKLVFEKEGYEKGTVTLTPIVKEVDRKFIKRNKYGYKYILEWPAFVNCDLKAKKEEKVKDTSIPKGEETKVVSRDNAGDTDLERTVIRWYFDSAPQGARIFWRVISSVPAEVKNTNENWLGSTPFEETRSFNIQGLTYKNSRDVQIEIKVRRKGYIDQTKRFNVRQAIDQQEISSFFDLVRDDE